MKSHPPGGENDSVIEEYMKATFGYRQKQIRTSLTEPGLVMAEYPRFKDFQNGSLFFSDFKLLYPEAKDFDKSFKEKYLNEIFLLANRKSVDIPQSPDECFKAMYVLVKLTPSITKLRKINLKLVFERLIVFVKENADLISLSETREAHLKQPFICCMGTIENPINYWLVIDREIVPCGKDFAEGFMVFLKNVFLKSKFPLPLLRHSVLPLNRYVL
ncbi:uncharacterized protein LOC116922348 isoform X2 [Daphnia magna]|uniref:uncharacterized protein LOC116922348 isoform X2 n=1 Tax=Daphnia magna TaxID=35525 RepID=UPI001402F023|nr:uncharacterized protein LOC116922348 isoform X2 [Daphnia magna]